MVRRPFVNRTEELSGLQRLWDTGEAQLFTLWGRRRVGTMPRQLWNFAVTICG